MNPGSIATAAFWIATTAAVTLIFTLDIRDARAINTKSPGENILAGVALVGYLAWAAIVAFL